MCVDMLHDEKVLHSRDLPQPICIAVNQLDAAIAISECESKAFGAVVQLIIRRACIRPTNHISLERLTQRWSRASRESCRARGS